MKLNLRTIEQDLNNAYLKQSLKREQIEKFKANLKIMFDRIDEKEYEENLKNIVSDFLKDTYYKNQYEINTKGRTDLVIHNGKSSKDTVAVIIEAKTPSNKAEMISRKRPNAKALHELLHYYMQERYLSDNKEIKHVIATNIYEWYIFDAVDFEKFFYNDKKLREDYGKWKNGLLSYPNTDWYYSEIARPYIENNLEQLSCTYFNLSGFKEIIDNTDKENDEKLINLYKILSPEHLLKKPFVNDSNTLNREFYNELLHIIGLEERPEKGKKLIYRKKEENREDGSLLENTLNKIKVRGNLEIIEKQEQYDENEEEQMYSVALELCITWLNRILFLKLLEGQLIKYHNGDPEYTFINSKVIQDFDELAELFFEVLAVKMEDRSTSVNDKFGKIPYLNSSLFEISGLEKNALHITALKGRLNLSVYNHTVLKDNKGKRISGEKNTLQYLFEFLESYDFSSESSATIQEENKTIINASVLGLIFEKINGYKDGSFFTPGFITMYMCRETIRRAVAQKFKELENPDIEKFEDVKAYCARYFKPEDILRFNKHINSLKICDPAVGSGHFLVSSLNEIIAIKSELNILADKKGIPLEFTVTVDNDELIVIHKSTNEPFEYHLGQDEKPPAHFQRMQETLFHEKQDIIEGCLFGVDINPKSVLICRLRLWIELLKNTYYKPDNYNDLEILPNIDINIKCGNSLISRFSLDADISQALNKSKWNIETYRLAVQSYREAPSPVVKKEMKQLIESIKNDLQIEIGRTDPKVKRLNKLEGEFFDSFMANRLIEVELTKRQKAEQNNKKEKLQKAIDKLKTEIEDVKNNKIYINAFEWRFEFPEVLDEKGNFIGFDVVIGNPPYFTLSKDPNNSYYAGQYEAFNTTGDIYCLFYELACKIIADSRYLSFITSNKWMRSTYGQQIRQYFSIHTQPYYLFDFSWYQVFENANVDTNILSVSKQSNEYTFLGAVAGKDFKIENLSDYSQCNSIKLKFEGSEYWSVKSQTSNTLKNKFETLGKKLELWDLKVNYGIKSGFNNAYQIDEKTKDELIYKDHKSAEIIVPILKGRDIERYGYSFANLYLINTYNGYADNIKDAEKHIEKFGKNKFRYKSDNTKDWHIANRIEHSKGHQVRVNRVIVEEDYPTIYEYLEKFEAGLKKREDQGTHWTNLRNCAYDPEFKKEKLVWAETMRVHKSDTQNFPRFGYDKNGTYTDKTVFIGVGQHLKYLLGFLNSSVGRWLIQEYVTKLDTGGYMIQKVFLDKIPIFVPSESQENKIVGVVDKILSAKKQNQDTKELEKQIEESVYELYGLTEEEIGIVEESIK